MSKTAKQLREEMAGIHHQMVDIQNEADKAKRDLTEDEEKRWNQFDKDFERLNSEVTRREKVEARQAEIDAEQGEDPKEKDKPEDRADKSKELKERRESAWTKYMVGGGNVLNEEERSILEGFQVDLTQEQRALTTQTDSSGGYTIPEGFQAELEKALLAFGGVRSVARILPTSTGNNMPWPTTNDTSNKGARLAENTQVSEQDVVFGSITLNAYTYSSKAIRVPRQLLQDSAFNLNVELPVMLAERIGRITNEEFTTADGSSKPQGVATGATNGVTAASATTFTWDELIDLEHSIGSSYRKNGKFMFTDTALKIAKKLKDGDGNYLWQRGNVAQGAPNTIMGYEYVINDDMAVPATGVKSILFGDFKKYIVRDVLGITLLRLAERYADYFQVGFMSFSRHDGKYLNAGTNPIKALTQA